MREIRTYGSERAKAKWLRYSTILKGFGRIVNHPQVILRTGFPGVTGTISSFIIDLAAHSPFASFQGCSARQVQLHDYVDFLGYHSEIIRSRVACLAATWRKFLKRLIMINFDKNLLSGNCVDLLSGT
jgi:hypothetical protein